MLAHLKSVPKYCWHHSIHCPCPVDTVQVNFLSFVLIHFTFFKFFRPKVVATFNAFKVSFLDAFAICLNYFISGGRLWSTGQETDHPSLLFNPGQIFILRLMASIKDQDQSVTKYPNILVSRKGTNDLI